MSNPALSLQGIEKAYNRDKPGEVHVLRGACIEITAGEVVALVAPSGAGKSTLLHIAGLLDVADAGSVQIGGRAMDGLSDRKRTAVRRGDGTTLTFSEVHIEGDGWLVMHPFVDGKPSGTHVAGFAFVEDGTNTDVKITLNPAPAAGDAYVVMLHSDADNDRVFDFVFVAENVVEDVAVFEGNKMIAHIITVPQ